MRINEIISEDIEQLEEGWKSKLGAAALAGAAMFGGGTQDVQAQHAPPAKFTNMIQADHSYDGLAPDIIANMYKDADQAALQTINDLNGPAMDLGLMSAWYQLGILSPKAAGAFEQAMTRFNKYYNIINYYAIPDSRVSVTIKQIDNFYRDAQYKESKKFNPSYSAQQAKQLYAGKYDEVAIDLSNRINSKLDKLESESKISEVFARYAGYSKQTLEYQRSKSKDKSSSVDKTQTIDYAGGTYKGHLDTDGRPSGSGSLTISGDTYQGEWKNNELTGIVRLADGESGIQYTGKFKEWDGRMWGGDFVGKVVAKYPDGTTIQGSWSDGKFVK